MSAFLNISYALVGQITLPTVRLCTDLAIKDSYMMTLLQFIAEMENPNDFPKGIFYFLSSTRYPEPDDVVQHSGPVRSPKSCSSPLQAS